ncbi:hypothetical protein LEN26_000011, partial [Aphanomyces euteiches]
RRFFQASSYMGDSSDDEECRVCRGEAEPGRRLFAPCKCSGSIRFVHSDCLTEWLAISKKEVCELCGHTFAFQPVYAEGCPKTLPTRELVWSVLVVAIKKWVPFVIRGVLVAIAWLVIAPWSTSWLYRLWLLRAATMGTVNFNDRVQKYDLIFDDVFSGIILVVVIVCSFLSLMSFADFLRFNMDQMVEEPNEEAELRHREMLVAQEMEAVEMVARIRGPQENVRLIERIDGVDEWIADDSEDGNSDGGSDDEADDEADDDAADAEPEVDAQARGRRQPHILAPLAGFRARQRAAFPAQPRRLRIRQQDNLPLFDEVIQHIPHAAVFRPHIARNVRPDPRIVEANQENRNNRRRAAPARNPAAAPGDNAPFPANNEWEDDFDHMEINIAMDEVIGFRGPLYILVRNVSWFLAFNGAYLGIFAFIPYTLGSTIVATFGKFVQFVDIPLHGPVEEMPVVYRFVGMAINTTEAAQSRGDCLQFVDVLTCAVGYFAFCGTIVMWRVLVNTISMYAHRQVLSGLLWFLSCLNAVVKVGTLLVLKMIVMPMVLGFGMDFATLQLFMVSPWERITFLMEHMLAALMIHWVLGISFMLFVTVAVLQMREVMHPDILAATIRPQEPNQDILKSMLAEPSIKHARRFILSVAIYAVLLTLLVYLPVRLMFAAAPSMFPLQLNFHYILAHAQVPLELVLAHMAVLNILDTYKHEVGYFQSMWMTTLCRKFGLVEYLLPRVPSVPGSEEDSLILNVPPLSLNQANDHPPENERLYGARYVPWPEDGLVDPTMIEYNLLPRKYPSHIPLRLTMLLVCCWWTTVVIIGAAALGPLFFGRLAMAMVERSSGIRHDSLNFAAGIMMMWVLVNGFKVCRVFLIHEKDIHPQLRSRGYSVRGMTLSSLITLVFTWGVLYPIMIGIIGALVFQSDSTPSFLEMHCFGFVVLHVGAWFACCFRLNKQRPRNQPPNQNAEQRADDRWEELRQAEPSLLNSFRLAYEEICFHLRAHDDGVEHDQDLSARCFDAANFMEHVVAPLGFAMAVCIVLPWLCSKAHGHLGWSHLSETHVFRAAFATQVLGLLTIASKAQASRWFSALHDSIRDESL